MAAQLAIPYETLIGLVAQLPLGEQRNLLRWLQEQTRRRELSDEEWQATFRSAVIDTPLVGPISLDRADWYDDDGR